MKRRYYLFCVASLLVLAISLSGCVTRVGHPTENITVEESTELPLTLEDCLSLGKDSLRASCLTELASLNGNDSLCSMVDTDYAFRKEECVWRAAVRRSDLAACDSFPSDYSSYGRDSCYAAIGAKKQDPSICDRISAGYSHDDCLYGVAVATGKASLCAGNELCLERVAIAQKDIVACNSLPTLRYSCVAGVAKESGDASFCSSIPDGNPDKDYCYALVASVNKDASVCGAVSDNQTRLQCLQGARETMNLSRGEIYARNDAVWRSDESVKLRDEAYDKCIPLVGTASFRGVVLFEECGKNCLGGCPNTGPGICYYALRNEQGCVAYVESREAADGDAVLQDTVYRSAKVNDTLEVSGKMLEYNSPYCGTDRKCKYFVIREEIGG